VNINVSLNNEPRGYACIHIATDTVTLFLNSISELFPHLNSMYFPFITIEDIIEEFIIHETIHKMIRIRDDRIIDGWHMVLCHLLSGLKECKCPISCFWRDT